MERCLGRKCALSLPEFRRLPIPGPLSLARAESLIKGGRDRVILEHIGSSSRRGH